ASNNTLVSGTHSGGFSFTARFVKVMAVACGSRITTNNPKRAVKLKPPLCVPDTSVLFDALYPSRKS
ncbi:MAG: hypothetical protein E7K65_17300, partial [Pseudomonas sp.]|nr:hypothetical protein [Pseudomonas sp.]